MTQSPEDSREAEMAAEHTADTKALPLLLTYRQNLEKEAGVLEASARSYRTRLIVLCSVAGVVGLYALYTTMTSAPPVLALAITGALFVAILFVSWRRSNMDLARRQQLDELHEKMLSAGRRIDGAERRLRR
jgi:hypothetical protein